MNEHTSDASLVLDQPSRDDLLALTSGMERPIEGSSATGVGISRLVALTWLLAYFEFKLKFFGSVLGYFWQLIRPLMLFGVLYVVFTQIVRIGGGINYYPLVLLTGIVIYTFFSESTSTSVSSLVDREALLRKIHFPILAIPLASVTSVFLSLLTNFAAVIVFVVASGIAITLSWLWLVPVMFFLFCFSSGVSMLLSALFVKYRDVKPIWEVVTTVLFYATPIIYPIEFVEQSHPDLTRYVMWNPIAVAVQQVRHAVIDPSAQSAADAAGGTVYLLVPLGIVVTLLVVGYVVFSRRAPDLAENL